MWVLRLSSLLRKNWAKGKLGNTQFPLIWTWSTSTVPLPQVMGQYYTYYYPSSCFIHIALVFTGWPLSAPVSHLGRRVTLGHHASLAFAWLSHCLTLSLFAVTSTVSRSADWVFCRRSLGWYLMLFSCVASDYGAGGADHRGLPFAILTISGQPRPQAKVVFVGFLHCEVTLFPLFLYCPLWKEVTIPSPYLRGGEL